MANASKYIEVLIDALTKFPGIGRKGAEKENSVIIAQMTPFFEN